MPIYSGTYSTEYWITQYKDGPDIAVTYSNWDDMYSIRLGYRNQYIYITDKTFKKHVDHFKSNVEVYLLGMIL